MPGKRRRLSDTTGENGHTTHMAGKRVYNKKAVKQAGKKKIKVPGKLRKAIKQVVNDAKVSGSLTNHYLGGYLTAISRQQRVATDGSSINACGLNMFDVTHIADAAAQLFKKKGAVNSTATLNPFTAGNFDPASLQVHVKNSYSTLRYKNVTPHCIVLKLFICAPKRKSCVIDSTAPAGYGKFNVTQVVKDSLMTPWSFWQNSLSIDQTNGFILPGWWNGSATGANSVYDFYREPTQSKSFNQGWKAEKVVYHIEPGQTVIHTVQGPKNQFVDFGKCWQGDVFENTQKFTRGVIAVMYNTLNAQSANNGAVPPVYSSVFGRYADVVDTSDKGYGLIVERTDHYSLCMPEQTGFTLTSTVTPTVFDLELRRPRSKTNVYDSLPITGQSIQTLDLSKENPVQNVSGP